MRLMAKSIFIAIILFFFTACNDDNATIKISKKDLKNVNCMQLVVFPEDKFLNDTVQTLYKFSDNCNYKLFISEKNDIICNSNQNVDKKILANFPSSYIRLNLTKGTQSIFYYYKDLTHKANKDDLKKAFRNLYDEINR